VVQRGNAKSPREGAARFGKRVWTIRMQQRQSTSAAAQRPIQKFDVSLSAIAWTRVQRLHSVAVLSGDLPLRVPVRLLCMSFLPAAPPRLSRSLSSGLVRSPSAPPQGGAPRTNGDGTSRGQTRRTSRDQPAHHPALTSSASAWRMSTRWESPWPVKHRLRLRKPPKVDVAHGRQKILRRVVTESMRNNLIY
jgi:hypothetical protein